MERVAGRFGDLRFDLFCIGGVVAATVCESCALVGVFAGELDLNLAEFSVGGGVGGGIGHGVEIGPLIDDLCDGVSEPVGIRVGGATGVSGDLLHGGVVGVALYSVVLQGLVQLLLGLLTGIDSDKLIGGIVSGVVGEAFGSDRIDGHLGGGEHRIGLPDFPLSL